MTVFTPSLDGATKKYRFGKLSVIAFSMGPKKSSVLQEIVFSSPMPKQ
jgi:hypothetical protein